MDDRFGDRRSLIQPVERTIGLTGDPVAGAGSKTADRTERPTSEATRKGAAHDAHLVPGCWVPVGGHNVIGISFLLGCGDVGVELVSGKLRAAIPAACPYPARYLPAWITVLPMGDEQRAEASRAGADAPTLPSRERLADELWSVAAQGMVNVDPARVPALTGLGVLCSPGAQPPASAADLRTGLRVLLRNLGARAELRRRGELLLGSTSAVATLSIEERLDAVGRTYVARRGRAGAVSGKTVRNSGRGRRIVEELADVLLEAEQRLRQSGEHPAASDRSLYAPRAIFAVAAEERLGYRWIGYHRRLRGPDDEGAWDDQTTLVLEALHPGVTRIEIDFQADDDHGLAALSTSLRDGQPRVASVERAPYILPTPYYVGIRNRPWWRAWIEFRLDLPEQEPIELRLLHVTRSEPANFNYDQPDRQPDWRELLTVAVTPLFDSLQHLELRAEVLATPANAIEAFAREVVAIGPYRFTGRDDVVVSPVATPGGDEQHVVYSTATPTAGMGYELNVGRARVDAYQRSSAS